LDKIPGSAVIAGAAAPAPSTRHQPSEGRRAIWFVALLLLAWALFGCAVVVMMVYGAFDHVALNAPVMAAILATGTAFLASLGGFLSWRNGRRVRAARR
jgi:hypothetical protein